MGRIRKALVAAGLAALTALGTGLGTEVPKTKAGWVALFTATAVAAMLAGYATFKVANTPTG
jgi:hypothetical protein